jgi:hypothetical protein
VANSPTAPSNKFLILAEDVAWCGDELMIFYRLWWSFLIKLKTIFIYFGIQQPIFAVTQWTWTPKWYGIYIHIKILPVLYRIND